MKAKNGIPMINENSAGLVEQRKINNIKKAEEIKKGNSLNCCSSR